ncbi:MAG TPA: hypothetical protein VNI61_04800 [Gemmatimonadales bacterium]|nr:hypothetical protein [Gemmatimonadales bacterium]
MKRSTLYTIAVLAALAALFFFLTAGQAREECTVCMEFRGRTNCATASAPAREQAVETARSTACGPIASGMDETIACGNTPPATVQCRPR